MSLKDTAKKAKPEGTTPFGAFGNKLVIIVPLKANLVSDIYTKKNPKTGEDEPSVSMLAGVVPLDSGVYDNPDTGKHIEYEAGESHRVFIGSWRIQDKLKDDINKPVIGRIGKGKPGKPGQKAPWVFLAPTEEEFDRAVNSGFDAVVDEIIADNQETEEEPVETVVAEEVQEEGERPF